MSEKILLVDDDELILAGYERTLRRQFSLETVFGPQQALDKCTTEGPYAVVVSDMRMPVMTGLQLLHRIHALSPDSILLILTGNADLRTAIDAVNEGDIFRFLEKPCPGEILTKVLNAALDQHRLKLAEKELLEKTLHGSIKVLTDVLALVNPEAFSTASRIAFYVKHIAAQLNLKNSWRFEMAAMLSQLGSVVLPTEILEAVRLGHPLTSDQEMRFESHPSVARNLLRHIPRLESIAEMVGRQRDAYKDQSHAPLADRDEEILGAQILKVCIEFEALIRTGRGRAWAITELFKSPEKLDPALVGLLAKLPLDALRCEQQTIDVSMLAAGMILDQDLHTKDGTLLVAKGIEVTETLVIRIMNFHQRGSLPDTICILAPVSTEAHCELKMGS